MQKPSLKPANANKPTMKVTLKSNPLVQVTPRQVLNPAFINPAQMATRNNGNSKNNFA